MNRLDKQNNTPDPKRIQLFFPDVDPNSQMKDEGGRWRMSTEIKWWRIKKEAYWQVSEMPSWAYCKYFRDGP